MLPIEVLFRVRERFIPVDRGEKARFLFAVQDNETIGE